MTSEAMRKRKAEEIQTRVAARPDPEAAAKHGLELDINQDRRKLPHLSSNSWQSDHELLPMPRGNHDGNALASQIVALNAKPRMLFAPGAAARSPVILTIKYDRE